MPTQTTCPRGHEVDADAVLCTVCWVRLDGEDPKAKRARLLGLTWPPSPTAAAVVGGVLLVTGVAGSLLLVDSTSPQIVASEASAPAAVASAPAAPAATPAATPLVDTATAVTAPLAATVTDPVTASPDGACVIQTRDQSIPCTVLGDTVSFEVCVPAATVALEVRTRPVPDAPWQDVSADITIGDQGTCSGSDVTAAVTADALGVASDAKWRLVGRDAAGERLWKSSLRSTNR